MATAKGSLAQLVFQQETTFKALPSTPDVKLLYFENENLNAQRNLITTPIIRSNRNPVKPISGNYSVNGSITTHLQAYNLGTLLKGLLGSVTTSGTNPYVHTIKVGNTLPSFLFEKGFTDISQYLRYQGCYISGANIDIQNEGYQKISFDITGAKYSVSGTAFDTTPTTSGGYQPFYGLQFASVLEGGSAIGNILNASINIKNNIDPKYTVGSLGEVYEAIVNNVEITGSITVLFENVTLLNKALNSTESSLKFVLQSGTGAGSAGNEYLEINIPELQYEVATPAITGNAGIELTLNFRGFYDNDAGASGVIFVLKNTESSL